MVKCPRYFFLLLVAALYFSTIPGAQAETAITNAGVQHNLILKGKGSIPDCFDFFIATIDDDDDDSVYGKKKTGKCFSEPVGANCFIFHYGDVAVALGFSSGSNDIRQHSPLPSSLLLFKRCLRI